jgi:hypothetical protein
MALFAVANSTTPAGTAQVVTGTSYTTIIAVCASSGNTTAGGGQTGPLRRGRLYDILVGTNGTPADNFVEWEVSRLTAGTTVTILGSVSSVSSGYMLDLADAGFGAFVTINGSAGSTAIFSRVDAPWYVGVNQRASYRWVAAPGGEIVYPANTSATGYNGLGLNVRSGGYTGTTTGAVMVSEL